MKGSGNPARAATASAVVQIRFFTVAGIRPASRPVTRIDNSALTEKRHSRYTFSATPIASKPGPRLALDAGTRNVLAAVNPVL